MPNIYYSFPSTFKSPPLQLDISESGALSSNRKLSLFFRNTNQAPHPSVASRDVMISNTYVISQLLNNLPPVSDIELTTLDQENTPTCQIVPFLYIIQKQLDFRLDFAKFLACLKNTIPDNTPQDLKDVVSSLDAELANYYKRLLYLLFSNECFPLSQICTTSAQSINDESLPESCVSSGSCVKNYGLRIKKLVSLPNNMTAKKVCDLVSQGYPVSRSIKKGVSNHIITIVDCEMLDEYTYRFKTFDSLNPANTNTWEQYAADALILEDVNNDNTLFYKLEHLYPIVEICNMNEETDESCCTETPTPSIQNNYFDIPS